MTQPDTLYPKTLYRIPGLEGAWRITTLRTTNMAADGKATLDLVRVQDDDDPVVSAALIGAAGAKIPQPEPVNLHDRLRAEIGRRLAVARAANAAKPGYWAAVTTHDGSGYDGLSRVIAVQMTADRTISRHVADGISDVPEPVRAGFEDIEPEAADVAEHIALHDPADAIRRYEGELQVLKRHQPTGEALPACEWCCQSWVCSDVRSLAHRLGVSVET